MMKNPKRILFGYFEQEETDLIIFPKHEDVFAHQALYLLENVDLSEEVGETIYSARIIPTLSFPLQIIDADWQGKGYFLYQSNLENDYLHYSTDEFGKINRMNPLSLCRLYDDMGETSYANLQIYLQELRIKRGGFAKIFEDNYPILFPLKKDYRRFEDYEKAYQEWQTAYNQYKFPKKPAYKDKGNVVVRLGCAPHWIQGIQETPEDSQHNPMEYLGSMYQFHIGLTGIYSYLFYSPLTQEFVQIDQMT